MKGFIGFAGIFAIIGILTLFGGAFFDLTTTGARCALGVSGVGQYNCDEFGGVVGSTIILPDRNVKIGTEAILKLRNLDDDTIEAMGPLYTTNERGFRMQIIMGIVGIMVIVGLLSYVFIKFSPGSKIDAGSYGICVILALVVVMTLHVAYTGLVEGQAEVPFTGVITLVQHPQVMWDVVDETSMLPGTLTSKDILEEGNP